MKSLYKFYKGSVGIEIGSHTKLEDAISIVLSLKYKPNLTRNYKEKLINLKKENSSLIIDYVFEIQEICKQLPVCTRRIKQKIKQDKTFNSGLHQ